MNYKALENAIHELNRLILDGKALEAFEKYYAENVVMQENEQTPTIGKAANRQREQDFFQQVTEFRKAEPLKIAIGEDTTMVEWFYDYTHLEWGIRKYKQVSVQQWQDGKIVAEKFYYAN